MQQTKPLLSDPLAQVKKKQQPEAYDQADNVKNCPVSRVKNNTESLKPGIMLRQKS